MNGGVGGYATDQIILRAEKLIPELNPKIVILGFLDQDIQCLPSMASKSHGIRYHKMNLNFITFQYLFDQK